MAEIGWKQRKKGRKAGPRDSEFPVPLDLEEIRSGAIFTCDFTDEGIPVCRIEANTSRGLRTFSNFHEFFGRPALEFFYFAGHGSWASERGGSEQPHHEAMLFDGSWSLERGNSGSPVFFMNACSDAHEEVEPFAEEVLRILASSDLDALKRRQLILAAEGLRFDVDQIGLLEPILRLYVDRHLNSEIREEQVAVASGIRKLIAMLPVTQLSRCEDWLKIERKTPPPLEMEVVKMITRKLTASLPEDTGHLKSINDQLIDLLRSYLNPRTLSKRFFGATALEASLSLALLRSQHLNDALEVLRSLRVNWFRATVARQARVTRTDLERRFPGGRSANARRCLTDLTAAAEAVQP